MAWKRKAARIVLVDPAGRVFLQHSHDPGDRSKGSWWELPGGGIDPGETTAQTAARELWEECGLRADEIGPVLWTRQVQFTFAGIAIDQHETVHVGWTDAPGEWKPTHLEALEALAFEGARWWDVEELAAANVRTIPDDLVDWLRRLPTRT